MIEYRNGDLFSAKVDALAHGCNTIGKMNAGIAKQFKQRSPDMFADYQQRCRSQLFLPGQGYLYRNPSKPHIINLATQVDGQAGIVYLEQALAWLSNSYKELEINSVAMPRIGCGLGNLDWNIVEEILQKNFQKSELEVEVWTP